MNNLFDIIYAHKKRGQSGFWGKYAYLNQYDTSAYNSNLLFNLQIEKLRSREESSLLFDRVNSFLKEIQSVSIDREQDELLNMTEEAIYNRILELLNSGLFSSPLNPRQRGLQKGKNGTVSYKEGSNKDTIKSESLALVNELRILSEAIASSSVDGRVRRLAQALGGLGVSKSPLQDQFRSYREYKANEAEVLAVEALTRQSRGWKAMQSGVWFNKGKQLIEDVFVFDTNIDINFDKPLTATVGKKDLQFSSLQEFIHYVDELNTTVNVHLSDELYEQLQMIRVLSVQVKSGIELQSLLNRASERNAIPLTKIGDLMIIRDLYQLYKDHYIDPSEESIELEAMANYWLSKSITMTNISKNDIYFTKDGFQTASQWMQLHRQMLKFQPALRKVSEAFFDTPHPYAFGPV